MYDDHQMFGVIVGGGLPLVGVPMITKLEGTAPTVE